MASALCSMRSGVGYWSPMTASANSWLLDPSIKLLCIINPSNPPSYTLSSDTIRQLVDIVKNDNPDLG